MMLQFRTLDFLGISSSSEVTARLRRLVDSAGVHLASSGLRLPLALRKMDPTCWLSEINFDLTICGTAFMALLQRPSSSTRTLYHGFSFFLSRIGDFVCHSYYPLFLFLGVGKAP